MKPLIKPTEQLEKTKLFIDKMKNASTSAQYEEAWIDFLHNLERIWNKTVSHLKRSPKYQGWTLRGKAETLRRKDPLLSYLINARGAEEHTIADITGREPGGIVINPAEGTALTIKEMTIDDGKISINADNPIKIEFIPSKMKLLPVINRGRKYDLPTSHLGESIDDKNPIEIARLAIKFYEGYIEEAEKHFVK